MSLDTIDNDLPNNIKDKNIRQILKEIEENKGVMGLLVISTSTWRFMLRQVGIGICRGFGFAIGGTAVLTIITRLLTYFIDINIPFLTDLLKEIVKLIKNA